MSCSSSDDTIEYQAIPKDIEIPQLFSDLLLPPLIPSDNLQTEEGINLGRELFLRTLIIW